MDILEKHGIIWESEPGASEEIAKRILGIEEPSDPPAEPEDGAGCVKRQDGN